MTKTMVGRVAAVQTVVTLCALALVLVGTWLAVSMMLVRQTDRTLDDLLARAVDYLEAGPEQEQVDWQWFAGELDESRARDVRLEVRDETHPQPLVSLGTGPSPGAFQLGCADREGRRICGRAGARYRALAARDLSADQALLRRLMFALTATCVVAGACVAFASISVTRRAIRPLSELAQRVTEVEPGSGAQLQPKATLQELEVLERRFADLVERFEHALAREKQFTAHASHELRTPLTLARAEVEALPNSEAACAALLHLEALIEVLLWFARTQAPLHGEEMELVNLADLLAQQLGEVDGNGSRAVVRQLPDEALVRGDERLLARATWNLLDNAIKHGAGSEISVCVLREDRSVVLRVTNGGPGITEELRERMFVPFVRGQNNANGFGLGLPFARAVARAHGGDVLLEDSRADRSTTLLLRLPLVAWHEEPAGLDSVQNCVAT